MMIDGISAVMLFVNDQKESLDFWVGKLDFRILKDVYLEPQLRWIQIASAESHEISIILYPKSLISSRKSKPLPVIIFKTKNIRVSIKQMKMKGIVFSHDLSSSALGKYIMFKDNEGNEFIIMEHLSDNNNNNRRTKV